MALFLVFALALLLVAVYGGYPLVLLLASRLGASAARPSDGEFSWPTVTLVVPAHNEEEVIEAKLANAREIDFPKDRLSVLVASDGSTDRTCDRVRAFLDSLDAEERARYTLVDRELRSGKSAVLSEEVPRLDSDVIVFTDANAFFRPDAVKHLVAAFADPAIGLVCGRLNYVDGAQSFASDEELYWRYEDTVKRWEGAAGHLLVANGSIYAVRSELFEPIPGAVADDFAIPLVVAARGYRLAYAPAAVADERLPEQGIENFRAKARIVTRGASALKIYWRQVLSSGPLRVGQYLFHKVLRWLTGVVLLSIFGLSAIGATDPLLAAALTAQVAFYLLGLAAYLLAKRGPVPGVLRLPFYFLLVNAAALVGLWDFLRRRERVIWEKSHTTRALPAAVQERGRPAEPRPISPARVGAVGLVLGLAALLGVEAGVRLTYTLRDATRTLRGAVPPHGALMRYEIEDPTHPGNWVLRPGTVYTVAQLARFRHPESPMPSLLERGRSLGLGPKEIAFAVNDSGYKGPPLIQPRPATRILALGDSCAFGSVFDAFSFPRVLERELAGAEEKVEVVNGGVSGYQPAHILARIDEWKGLAPDLTILCVGWNALYSRAEAAPERVDRIFTLRVLSALRARWRGAIDPRELARERMARARLPEPGAPEVRRSLEYEAPFIPDLERVVREMRDAGSRVVLVTLPSLYLLEHHPSSEAMAIGHLPDFTDNPFVVAALAASYNQSLRELAARQGAELEDLAAWGRAAFDPRHEYFANASFLNERGQERVGTELAVRLRPGIEDRSR